MTKKDQSKGETRITVEFAVLLFFLAATSIQAQTPRFFNPSFFPTTSYVAALVVADFNGDGIADVATCWGGDPGTVNILLGNLDGTFGAPQSYDVGVVPVAIAVADFNGDGYLDIVTADYGQYFDIPLLGGNVVSVLLGNGDGTFQKDKKFPAGVFPNSVAVGDFNGDGDPDLAVANLSGRFGTVSVLLGDGDGTFAHPVAYSTAVEAAKVVAHDFNGDGKLDLAATANRGEVVSVLLGNGDGTFQTHRDFAAGEHPYNLAVADFNRDSKSDLVVTSLLFESTPTYNVLLGNGDGTFQPPIEGTTPRDSYDLAVGDLDGDGTPDMVLASLSMTSVFKGNGDGTFRAPLFYGPASSTMADLRGNGIIDLIGGLATNQDIGIIVIRGNGDGTFQARTELPSPYGGSVPSQATGDLNGDGKVDVVATDPFGPAVGVFLNTGDGHFSSYTNYPTGTDPWGVAIGDVNGDGKPDLVTANRYGSNSISVLLGNGDGTFQPRTDYATAALTMGVVLTDFDHDGNTDVATANNSSGPGTISILFGRGDGTFETPQQYTAGDDPRSLVTADFDGDGNTDLAVTYFLWDGGNVSSYVSVFLNNGDRIFEPRVDYSIPGGNHCVVAGDVNRDGIPDMVVSSSFGTVSVLLGYGDGTFAAPVDYPAGYTPKSCLLGDLNGDGIPDIVVGGGGTVSLLLGNGDGTFQLASAYLANSPDTMSAADLNGDGALDIAASNLYPGFTTSTTTSIFFNTGGTGVSLVSSENPSHAGDPVTFAATVRPTFGSLGIPSGTVQFFDGSNLLGSTALLGKKATFTSSTLPAGKHQIRANYLGDSTFVPNRAKRLVQKVRAGN